MATLDGLKTKIQGLIDLSNEKTGRTDTDLTTSVNALAQGYGQGEIVEEYDGRITISGGEPTLITFTVAGTTYQAEDGMTWGDFIKSDYNTDGFTTAMGSENFYDTEYVLLEYGHGYITYNGAFIRAGTLIINNASYATEIL